KVVANLGREDQLDPAQVDRLLASLAPYGTGEVQRPESLAIHDARECGTIHVLNHLADDQHVYYTTLNGEVGCLSAESGEKVWSVSTQEGAIVAPPSIYDGTLLVLADSSLYLV